MYCELDTVNLTTQLALNGLNNAVSLAAVGMIYQFFLVLPTHVRILPQGSLLVSQTS